MSKKFILKSHFEEGLNREEFLMAKELYLETLENNPCAPISHGSTIELIKLTKRDLGPIGPYIDLTIFESLNRIGSDLVLLTGAEKLFNDKIPGISPSTITLKMGNKAGEDIIIKTTDGKTIFGEAFNAAPSFCKTKMRDSIHKLLKNQEVIKEKKAVIFCNEDIKEILTGYSNQRLLVQHGFKLHIIYCDYEKNLIPQLETN
ncbi:hypothetical protein [Christiangramia forsetii]|uniref:Uncharacterized protein n=2 Tax=Christiangramia forsetii TaxID=411153 RepID=A0M4K1_CHRFK|nr:hypothetical protein [Christiangramia forsetii]GGG23257.1 hypothetical protein GCM10011532_02970 [Christiangramia forsetii]CAL67546.1 hypothetical protein GFO_2590 [Christiangramia forsetii KT0803]